MAVAGKAGITLDDKWDSTKEYDRLTGVSYNNKLFISRKRPPVGTAPEEGEYWMLAIDRIVEDELDNYKTEMASKLEAFVEKKDIADTLDSDSSDVPLAAKQGKALSGKIGTLSSLLTTAKNSLVAAVNELFNKIGDLSALKTTDKSSVVAALNEQYGTIDALKFSSNWGEPITIKNSTCLIVFCNTADTVLYLYNSNEKTLSKVFTKSNYIGLTMTVSSDNTTITLTPSTGGRIQGIYL